MEFIVVVVGVLLALWLQEWGERRKALNSMAAAEAAIHDEVRETLKSLIWREAIRKCHRDRTQLILDRLLDASGQWPCINENVLSPGGGKVPTSVAPGIYQRPVDTFTDAAWTSALATGALAPMDRERFGQLVSIYDQIAFLRKTREIEDDAASRLSPLVHPLEMTPELRAEMLRGVYDLDRTRFVFEFQGNPADFATSMRRLGWNDAAEIDRSLTEGDQDVARRGIEFRPCVAKEKNPFRAAGAPL
jgi:hypothetical protein